MADLLNNTLGNQIRIDKQGAYNMGRHKRNSSLRLDTKASYTAEAAAALRAATARESDPNIRNPDYLAESLISPIHRFLVRIPTLRKLGLRYSEQIAPGVYRYHHARTCHLDYYLVDALPHIDQIVILGAGFDTRAFRFADRIANTPLFEVDHPSTQTLKRQRLKQLKQWPDNITLVPADLRTEALIDVLTNAGFNPELSTFFIWEGVTMYLPDEAIRNTLGVVSKCAPGSRIIFDYWYDDVFKNPDSYATAQANFRCVEKKGEPYLSGLPDQDLSPYLSSIGLDLIDNADAHMLADNYLRRSNGESWGPMIDFAGIALAGVGIKAADPQCAS